MNKVNWLDPWYMWQRSRLAIKTDIRSTGSIPAMGREHFNLPMFSSYGNRHLFDFFLRPHPL